MSCEAERSVLVLHRLKTSLRFMMSQERLALIHDHVHQEISFKVKDNVCNQASMKNETSKHFKGCGLLSGCVK